MLYISITNKQSLIKGAIHLPKKHYRLGIVWEIGHLFGILGWLWCFYLIFFDIPLVFDALKIFLEAFYKIPLEFVVTLLENLPVRLEPIVDSSDRRKFELKKLSSFSIFPLIGLQIVYELFSCLVIDLHVFSFCFSHLFYLIIISYTYFLWEF